eukprot:2967097-Prymnesium_polylepis.3
MATPFLMGLGVAGAAMAARAGLIAVERVAANPEYLKQAGAAAAGVRGMGGVFKNLPNQMGLGGMFASESSTGFNSVMNRTEAAKILGVRCAQQRVSRLHPLHPSATRSSRGAPYLSSRVLTPPQGVGQQGGCQVGAPQDDADEPPGSWRLALHRLQDQRGQRGAAGV